MFIGQKVVCINDRFPLRILEWTSELPRKDRIYTISVIVHGHSVYNGEPKIGFRLIELQTGERIGFFAERFVPLLEELDQACRQNALELTSRRRVELPALAPAVYDCSSLKYESLLKERLATDMESKSRAAMKFTFAPTIAGFVTLARFCDIPVRFQRYI